MSAYTVVISFHSPALFSPRALHPSDFIRDPRHSSATAEVESEEQKDKIEAPCESSTSQLSSPKKGRGEVQLEAVSQFGIGNLGHFILAFRTFIHIIVAELARGLKQRIDTRLQEYQDTDASTPLPLHFTQSIWIARCLPKDTATQMTRLAWEGLSTVLNIFLAHLEEHNLPTVDAIQGTVSRKMQVEPWTQRRVMAFYNIGGSVDVVVRTLAERMMKEHRKEFLRMLGVPSALSDASDNES